MSFGVIFELIWRHELLATGTRQRLRAGELPLDFKLPHNVTDLLVQHIGQLEQEALDKGGIQQLLAERFATVYKVATPGLSAA